MTRYPKGSQRPVAPSFIRLLIRLYSIYPFYKLKLIKRILLKCLGLPQSTSISKGFYCLSRDLSVGKNTGLGNCFIQNLEMVSIGDNCSLSYNNTILTGTHDFKDFSTIIAKPVTIGDNVVIGAGSVVTRDIPSHCFAAGNPCRVIKKITFNK